MRDLLKTDCCKLMADSSMRFMNKRLLTGFLSVLLFFSVATVAVASNVGMEQGAFTIKVISDSVFIKEIIED